MAFENIPRIWKHILIWYFALTKVEDKHALLDSIDGNEDFIPMTWIKQKSQRFLSAINNLLG